MKKLIFALVITIAVVSLATADTIRLRNGRIVRGTVLGFINGRFAIRVDDLQASSTNSNQQTTNQNSTSTRNQNGQVVFIRPGAIESIEIDGRSLEDARYQTRAVDVTLGPNWIDSGVDVRRGDRIRITSSGTIYAGRTRITPDGLRSTDPYSPLPRAREGVLIAAIGNDSNAPIIEVGLSREFEADRDGRIYLTANRSSYTDARGSFNAQIRTEVDFAQRSNNNRTEDARRTDENNDNYDPFGTDSNRIDPAPPRTRTPGDQNQNNTITNRDNRTPQEKIINVAGNTRSIDTGIDLRNGDQVTFTASGTIVAGRKAGSVSPDGGRVGAAAILGTYPAPNAGVGALIGYIRLSNGQISQPFIIGSQSTLSVPVDGRLYLGINDDNFSDNTGSFSVKIVY